MRVELNPNYLNREAIEDTIEAIKEAPDYKFLMGYWYGEPVTQQYIEEHQLQDIPEYRKYISIEQDNFDPHQCKTVACLGGWAAFANKVPLKFAGNIFGLTSTQAELLFGGGKFGTLGIDALPEDQRKAVGIRVLELMLSDEIIDWDRAYNEVVNGAKP